MTNTQNTLMVGDRVHLEHEGAWLFATIADWLDDGSIVVAGYMANFAKRVNPTQVKKVCKTCGDCRALNERPWCAYKG